MNFLKFFDEIKNKSKAEKGISFEQYCIDYIKRNINGICPGGIVYNYNDYAVSHPAFPKEDCGVDIIIERPNDKMIMIVQCKFKGDKKSVSQKEVSTTFIFRIKYKKNIFGPTIVMCTSDKKCKFFDEMSDDDIKFYLFGDFVNEKMEDEYDIKMKKLVKTKDKINMASELAKDIRDLMKQYSITVLDHKKYGVHWLYKVVIENDTIDTANIYINDKNRGKWFDVRSIIFDKRCIRYHIINQVQIHIDEPIDIKLWFIMYDKYPSQVYNYKITDMITDWRKLFWDNTSNIGILKGYIGLEDPYMTKINVTLDIAINGQINGKRTALDTMFKYEKEIFSAYTKAPMPLKYKYIWCNGHYIQYQDEYSSDKQQTNIKVTDHKMIKNCNFDEYCELLNCNHMITIITEPRDVFHHEIIDLLDNSAEVVIEKVTAMIKNHPERPLSGVNKPEVQCVDEIIKYGYTNFSFDKYKAYAKPTVENASVIGIPVADDKIMLIKNDKKLSKYKIVNSSKCVIVNNCTEDCKSTAGEYTLPSLLIVSADEKYNFDHEIKEILEKGYTSSGINDSIIEDISDICTRYKNRNAATLLPPLLCWFVGHHTNYYYEDILEIKALMSKTTLQKYETTFYNAQVNLMIDKWIAIEKEKIHKLEIEKIL
jgi:hypothetical protein